MRVPPFFSSCFALLAWPWLAAGAEVIPPPEAPVCNHVRYFPAPAREKEMVGGKFSGSNVSQTEGFKVLTEIKEEPRPGQWTDLVFPNNKLYRWLRYDPPAGVHGSVAELEFYSGSKKLDGMRYGSIGEINGRGWWLAFDGDTNSWVDTEGTDGQYAGLDLREQATALHPRLSPPPTIEPEKPVSVLLNCLVPFATIRYTLDGTMPSLTNGLLYKDRFPIAKTTTVIAASFVEGWAASPPVIATYLIGDAPPGQSTLHVGSTFTGVTGDFGQQVRTTGRPHESRNFTMPNGTAKRLWEARQKDRKTDWEVAWNILPRIDHLTLEPRHFNLAEEAEDDLQFIQLVRQKTPEVQPWLFSEWVERERQRPTDRGEMPSTQMTHVWPALTWEESMSAMLVYVEDVRRKLTELDHGPKPTRVLPSNLALGWLKHLIDRGEFPGAQPGDFYPLFFRDSAHLNPKGAYLINLTWYAAFYRESPEGKMLPVGTDLTPPQIARLQRLAWDTIQNYPDCGLYEEGKTPVAQPEFSPAATTLTEPTTITLKSSTPGAWFRYTLDGTTPTRTTGYVYCGAITARPGMTVKAVAYQSGLADSPVASANYIAVPHNPAPRLTPKIP